MALMARNKIGVLKVEDPAHPATKMIGPSWPLVDECYQFGITVWDARSETEQISQVGRLHIPMAFSRDRVHVLLSRSFYMSLGTETTSGPPIRKTNQSRSRPDGVSTRRRRPIST